MKICLDLRYKTESGASVYIKNIVPALLSSGSGHRFFGVISAGQTLPFLDSLEKVVVCPSNDDLTYMAWTLLHLPGLLRDIGADLYHGMKLPGPWHNPVRSIHTMHSVLRDKVAGFPSTMSAKVFNAVYGAPILKHLDRFIAVSEFVRNDLITNHHIPGERIDVIPHGLDSRFKRLPRAAGSPRRYVMCIGNVFPVKNHLTAVRAFARIASRHPDVDLLIAGALQDAYANRVRAEIKRSGLTARVKLLGLVPVNELIPLLNGSELVLFPSMTEGFGFAVLEAMACGVPTVISRIAALAELEPTLFVDNPLDDAAFAAQAEKLLADPALRVVASDRAVEAASRYTWKQSADGHLASYAKAVAGGRS